jgi:xanthine dehydrogenase large subunit
MRMTDIAAFELVKSTGDLQPSPESVVWHNGFVHDARRASLRMSWKDLIKACYLSRVSLGERGFFSTQGLDWNAEKGSGNPFRYFTKGCAVSEVAIDRFTGALRVLRSDLLMDIGKSINPGIDRGQLTGAFIQGMGWLTTEEMRYAASGELLSHSPTTYKIPNIQDLPPTFNVDWIENDANIVNVRSSKAVGEPPLVLAVSVWCAVKNALSFVSQGEIAKLDAPATGEEILARLTHYKRAGRVVAGDVAVAAAG